MKNSTLLTIPNNHIEDCGQPPALKIGANLWTGYFENSHGEQAVFQYDFSADVCRLWMGDLGWENELRVTEFRGRTVVTHATPRDRTEVPDEVVKAVKSSLRKAFGKPTLSDAECEFLASMPILSHEEQDIISAFWRVCSELRKFRSKMSS